MSIRTSQLELSTRSRRSGRSVSILCWTNSDSDIMTTLSSKLEPEHCTRGLLIVERIDKKNIIALGLFHLSQKPHGWGMIWNFGWTCSKLGQLGLARESAGTVILKQTVQTSNHCTSKQLKTTNIISIMT